MIEKVTAFFLESESDLHVGIEGQPHIYPSPAVFSDSEID